MSGKVLKLLMDPERSATENLNGSRDVAKFVGIVRDAMILGMLGLVAWSISTIHELSIDFTIIKSNYVTQEQIAAQERHFTELLAQSQVVTSDALTRILGQLSTMNAELGKISGKLENRDARR